MARPSSILLCALLGLSCEPPTPARPPPAGRFYFPTSVAHGPSASDPDGIVYVASHNLDKRYDEGSLIAVRLANVLQPDGGRGLPPLGAPVPTTGPLNITNLNIADGGTVLIQSFAGEVGTFPLPGGGMRLFIPTHAECDYVQVVDAQEDQLSCYGPLKGQANCVPMPAGAPNELSCDPSGLSLTTFNPQGDAGLVQATSKPRSPQPFGIGMTQDGHALVAHLAAADDPINSGTNLETFIADIPADAPRVDPASFHSLLVSGTYTGPANSVAVGQRYAYISGRYFQAAFPSALLIRTLDRWTGAVAGVGVENDYSATDSRGVAISTDETRLYLAARSPDGLVVASIDGATSDAPRIHETRAIPLPAGPDEVAVISRRALGLGDLVVVTCGSSNAAIIYDDDLQQVVSEIPAVGTQPFGIAVDNRGTQARVFISNFGDGTVAVIDIPSLAQAGQAQIVARLGEPQTCLVTPTDASCPPGSGVNP